MYARGGRKAAVTDERAIDLSTCRLCKKSPLLEAS